MRTTLDLNDALIVRAKEHAARERTTLTKLIEEGLAMRLDERLPESAPPSAFEWRVFDGGSVRPGIDATSNESIYAAAELEDDVRIARSDRSAPPPGAHAS